MRSYQPPVLRSGSRRTLTKPRDQVTGKHIARQLRRADSACCNASDIPALRCAALHARKRHETRSHPCMQWLAWPCLSASPEPLQSTPLFARPTLLASCGRHFAARWPSNRISFVTPTDRARVSLLMLLRLLSRACQPHCQSCRICLISCSSSLPVP